MENQRIDIFDLISKTAHHRQPKDALYNFTQAYTKYMELNHNNSELYGLTGNEFHTLKHICLNPGLTITDIVNYWGRTKGTVSSQVKDLVEKGLVEKKKCKKNGKVVHIYPTRLGIEVNDRHTAFDVDEFSQRINHWLKKYSQEDIVKFWEQLEYFTDFLMIKIKND